METITVSDNDLMLPEGLPLRQESVTEQHFPDSEESVYNEFSQRQKTIDIDMLRCEMEKSGELIASVDEDIVENTGSCLSGDEDHFLQRFNVRNVTETRSLSPTEEVPLLASPMAASECFMVDQTPPHSTLESIARPKNRLFSFKSSLSKQTQETESVKSRIKVRYLLLTERNSRLDFLKLMNVHYRTGGGSQKMIKLA